MFEKKIYKILKDVVKLYHDICDSYNEKDKGSVKLPDAQVNLGENNNRDVQVIVVEEKNEIEKVFLDKPELKEYNDKLIQEGYVLEDIIIEKSSCSREGCGVNNDTSDEIVIMNHRQPASYKKVFMEDIFNTVAYIYDEERGRKYWGAEATCLHVSSTITMVVYDDNDDATQVSESINKDLKSPNYDNDAELLRLGRLYYKELVTYSETYDDTCYCD